MTLDQQRRAGFIEFAPRLGGFAALWHVADSVMNVAEGADFQAVLDRAQEWACSEGVPLVRRSH